jgi:hypothetical protein
MKKFLAVLVVLIFVVFGGMAMSAQQGYWTTGTVTNPAANANIVQSAPVNDGAVTGSYYSVIFALTNKTAAPVEFLVGAWNAGGAAAKTLSVMCPANTTYDYNAGGPFAVPNGYTLRIQTPVAVTGVVAGAISQALESNY